jgi:RecB family endonuclease NucS
MSDIKLFRLQNHKAAEIAGTASQLEKPLQTLIEDNLEPLLGIRLVATEYPTGKTHSGRIDTLGLDENLCPVILEYKRTSSVRLHTVRWLGRSTIRYRSNVRLAR